MTSANSDFQSSLLPSNTNAGSACVLPEAPLPSCGLLALDRPLQFGRSDDDLPFKKAGRDYHEPNVEVAMLSALLNSPSAAENFAVLLDEEDFYNRKNKTIFAALLHLLTSHGAVSRQALERHLQETEEDFDERWQNHIDRCMETSFNEKIIERYVLALKKATEIRDANGYCIWTFSEPFYADRLRANLGNKLLDSLL